MAYDARPAAIRERLDKAAKTSREVFKKVHRDALEERVRDRLERYFDDRERALTDGVRLLESPLPPQDHQERWSRHFTEFGSRQAKEIAELVKDPKLIQTPFVSSVSSIAAQESAFFAAVAKMPMASSQGEILQWYGQFEREMKRLRDDWKELKGDGGEISEEMREVMREIREVFAEAVQEASGKSRDAEESLRRWIPVAEQGEEAIGAAEPGPVGTALQAIGHVLDVLRELRPSVETLESRFRALYRSEETVSIILLGGTRVRVKEFLDAVNLEAAVEELEAASETCLRIAQGLKPDGQRDDAEDLVDLMMDEANETLEQFEDIFEELVDEFDEIFIGPVGDRTVQDLVNKQLAIRESDDFQRLNIQTELRKIHDSAEDWLGIPIGRLDPAVRERLKEWMERDLEALALATRQASDLSASERLSFVMKRSWDDLTERLLRLSGKTL